MLNPLHFIFLWGRGFNVNWFVFAFVYLTYCLILFDRKKSKMAKKKKLMIFFSLVTTKGEKFSEFSAFLPSKFKYIFKVRKFHDLKLIFLYLILLCSQKNHSFHVAFGVTLLALR